MATELKEPQTNEALLRDGRSYHHPFLQLILARLREFYREPEAIFWVYGFPLLMAVGLGIAFRERPVDKVVVDIQDSASAAAIKSALDATGTFIAQIHPADECAARLRVGKTPVVVVPGQTYQYLFDRGRPESAYARQVVDDALQRAAGRHDPVPVEDHFTNEPGARYIDFLIPGLLGMNLMGGGLWGVGFVTVDMRVRKLLKRFVATPMRRSHFLGAIIASRILFMVPEVLLLLIFGRLFFHLPIRGSVLAIMLLVLAGALTFAGLGLLIASRAKTIETISGLMNLVMLPMWLVSGIFFSSERFPDAVQPLIKALPLTPLIDSLRAVILEGASLPSQWPRLAILLAWAAVCFPLSLRWFRWS